MNEKITPTDYESLCFMLRLPFTVEGGDTAEYSADEIDTVLDYARKIKASLDTAERELDAVRKAAGAYPDSDLASYVTGLAAGYKQFEETYELLNASKSASGERLTMRVAKLLDERDTWRNRALSAELDLAMIRGILAPLPLAPRAVNVQRTAGEAEQARRDDAQE